MAPSNARKPGATDASELPGIVPLGRLNGSFATPNADKNQAPLSRAERRRLRRAGITASSPDAPWVADDRAWFELHPTRAVRLRDFFPGELPPIAVPEGHALRVIVRQVEPGTRVRWPLLFRADPPGAEHDEAELMALFDTVRP